MTFLPRKQSSPISHFALPTTPTVRHLLHRFRRPLAIVLGAVALLIATASARPSPEPTTAVVTANRTIKAGHTLTQDDLATTQWPIALGAQASYFSNPAEAVGRMTAGPVAQGEPLNSGRIVGPSLLGESELSSGNSNSLGNTPEGVSGSEPQVASIVRLADKAYLALARPGDFVDILGADAQTIGDFDREKSNETSASLPKAIVLAKGARVLAIPGNDPESGLGAVIGAQPQNSAANTESVVVLAVTQETAAALAGASTKYRFSMVVNPN